MAFGVQYGTCLLSVSVMLRAEFEDEVANLEFNTPLRLRKVNIFSRLLSLLCVVQNDHKYKQSRATQYLGMPRKSENFHPVYKKYLEVVKVYSTVRLMLRQGEEKPLFHIQTIVLLIGASCSPTQRPPPYIHP